MSLHFRTGHNDEADALVRRYHYTGRPPANVQLVATWHEDGGLFGDAGPAVAACYFSIPPTRWSAPVWELSRLVRADHVAAPLSGLVAATVRHIKRRRCAVDLLVSFADATQGHHGGIYQACSWRYHGQRSRQMDGVVVNGTMVPGRTLNSIYGTRSPAKLAALGLTVEPHYDDGKHLYWLPIGKRGTRTAQRLNLRSSAYPKPAAVAS